MAPTESTTCSQSQTESNNNKIVYFTCIYKLINNSTNHKHSLYYYNFLIIFYLSLIQEYQQKTERCAVVREVLKSHIAALPNLATPSSKRLAPLPSAGDLFS